MTALKAKSIDHYLSGAQDCIECAMEQLNIESKVCPHCQLTVRESKTQYDCWTGLQSARNKIGRIRERIEALRKEEVNHG
jgi:hypothetical protein